MSFWSASLLLNTNQLWRQWTTFETARYCMLSSIVGSCALIIKYSSNVIFTIIIIKEKTQYVYRTSASIFYRRKMLTCYSLTVREDQYVFRKLGYDFRLETDQF